MQFARRKGFWVPPEQRIKNWRIVTGDKVQVLFGKDAGKQGIVKKVLRKQNRLIVEGVNLVKKHVKSTPDFKGGIFSKEAPITYSRVGLLDPKLGEPTSVIIKFTEEGRKVRVSRKSGEVIPKPGPSPAYLKKIREWQERGDGPKDTPVLIAQKKTFIPTKSLDELD